MVCHIVTTATLAKTVIKLALIILFNITSSYTIPLPQEQSHGYEGDILFPKGFKTISNKLGVMSAANTWENGIIPFTIVTEESGFNERNRNEILEAIEEIQNRSCVRFIHHTTEADYVSFIDGDGCDSFVGRQKGKQIVILNKHKCLKRGTILHEILHSLGLQHEQNRLDRNRFVTILWGNVNQKEFPSFRKHEELQFGLPYDYSSIMHYSQDAMQKRQGGHTILPLRQGLIIGLETHLSYYDILKINLLYNCINKLPKGLRGIKAPSTQP